MQIDKLRLMGFKSFVEPTDLVISRGLTGVVGPNGCGKSNLLEALRWVMGESSYKSMRASAMDDVIFSGTASRPARNSAEVTITIDNSRRTAPAEFNDSDAIEVTRRIEREAGSSYRINGRDARARDVKILFEDAATGARSPALVRQGQIGEIVNAKPEQRRRVLEDAAGIAGLHSRRHEAELRLKAAEGNLARLGDVIDQLISQREGLKRQARQARRYTDLSDQIREAEATVLYLAWRQAQADVERDEAAMQSALAALGVAVQEEAAAIRAEAELADTLKPLREQETIRAAVATAKRQERDRLAQEADRTEQRRQDLEAQAERLAADALRERDLAREASERGERLAAEHTELSQARDAEQGQEEALSGELAAAARTVEQLEREEGSLEKQLSERRSEERSLRLIIEERSARRRRLEGEVERLAREAAELAAQIPDEADTVAADAAVAQARQRVSEFEAERSAGERDVVDARGALKAAEAGREEARLERKSLETERQTLARLLAAPAQAFQPVLDDIEVAKGLEVALAVALGDDIEAALDPAAPVYWGNWEAVDGGDAPLPEGVEALINHVRAPTALNRRLSQIGLVASSEGARLQGSLMQGQRLVSRDGALWRWDGFVARADAPSAAAQRLAGRNRLAEVTRDLQAVHERVTASENVARASAERLAAAEKRIGDLTGAIRDAGKRLRDFETAAGALAAKARDGTARLGLARERQDTAAREAAMLAALIEEADARLASLSPLAALEDARARLKEALRSEREKAAGLKAALDGLARERQRVTARLAQITAELGDLDRRRRETAAREAEIANRLETNAQEKARIADRPAEIQARLDALQGEIESAEREHRTAGDAVAEAEVARGALQSRLRELAGGVAETREARARAEARLEAARQKRSDVQKSIDEQMEASPEGCLEIAGLDAARLPRPEEAEGKLFRLKAERERLGGVNLQAEAELAEVDGRCQKLEDDRRDVEEAIAMLRAGIASLNREGRKRLRDAFSVVDEHFQTLFKTLFNGGEARLEMIESEEDPLAGGLEIIARPPGKKPATLSLLSGGEQTLTALSLIFAVFLTNPSPICVLDEVDAPLDDANVDRFCRMMEKMAADTDTRFLCITHHPETMARMHRLFGVTMAERGVSQLVSVDLEMAERFLEAGE